MDIDELSGLVVRLPTSTLIEVAAALAPVAAEDEGAALIVGLLSQEIDRRIPSGFDAESEIAARDAFLRVLGGNG